jgi:hypothetical protein
MPTLSQLKQAVSIAEQIENLQTQLASLVGGSAPVVSAPKAASSPVAMPGKRTMSPEARASIAAAQRARWAKSKGAAKASAAKPVEKPVSGKRFVSAESRAKMAAAQQARWAKKSGASTTPAAKPVKKKGGLSPEGRARIVAALKARHAAKRAGKK